MNSNALASFTAPPAAMAGQQRFSRRRWIAAGGWLALIYGAIPWARQVQEWVGGASGTFLFLGITAAALLGCSCWLLWARSRRIVLISPPKVAVLLAIAALYGWLASRLRGNPEELVHCIEYAILAGLLFRAFRVSLNTWSAVFAAAMAGIGCGITDELIQWLVPARYFDFRDIGINTTAVVLTLVALASCLRSLPSSPQGAETNWQPGLLLTATNLALLLLCFSATASNLKRSAAILPLLASMDEVTAEYGYKHRTPAGDSLYSRLDHTELTRQDRLRFAEVIPVLERYRTDQEYGVFVQNFPAFRDPLLVEARIHLFRRDRYALLTAQARHHPKHRQDFATIAIGENRLLETYFPNILRFSSYRWHPLIKTRLLAMGNGQIPYHSPVSNALITAVSLQTIQGGLLLAIGGTLLLVLLIGRQNRRPLRQSATS